MATNNSITYTLEQFINSAPINSLSYQSFCFIENSEMPTGDIIGFPVYTIINDYLPELKELCRTITLSDKELEQYKYRPKLLAHFLYGETELDFIILKLNDIFSVNDFDRQTLKLISKSDLYRALTDIRSSEKNNLKIYNDFANSETEKKNILKTVSTT